MSVWTDELVALVVQMWRDGCSAGMIEREIGGVASRNAIIGKIHRLGLPRRAQHFPGHRVAGVPKNLKQTAFGKEFKPAPRINPAENEHSASVAAKRAPAYVTLAKAFKSPSPVKFEDLGAHHCRWVEQQLTGTSLHCGCEVIPGTSWCRTHHLVVFRQPIVEPRKTWTKEENHQKEPENA